MKNFSNSQISNLKSQLRKGFTLLETIIVIAILGILSLFGMLIITSFQKDALLDSTAREFASALKSASNKSVAGETEAVGALTPTIAYLENGLPRYGVKTTASSYTIYSISDPPGIAPTPAPIAIDDKLTLDIEDVLFYRMTGTISAIKKFILKGSGERQKQVTVDTNGMIEITSYTPTPTP